MDDDGSARIVAMDSRAVANLLHLALLGLDESWQPGECCPHCEPTCAALQLMHEDRTLHAVARLHPGFGSPRWWDGKALLWHKIEAQWTADCEGCRKSRDGEADVPA